MGLWEKGVWYLGGLSTYTRSGFNEAYRNFDKNALNIDLSGKVYIVTGTISEMCKLKLHQIRGE